MCEETWPSWWLLLLQKPPRPPELCQVPVAPLPGSGSVLQQPGGDMKYLWGKSPFCARESGSSSSSCSEIHSTERKAQTRESLWVLYLIGIRHKRRKTPVLVWDGAKPTVSKRLENPSESPGIKLVGITASSMNFLGKKILCREAVPCQQLLSRSIPLHLLFFACGRGQEVLCCLKTAQGSCRTALVGAFRVLFYFYYEPRGISCSFA